jgi:hypothetical protein
MKATIDDPKKPCAGSRRLGSEPDGVGWAMTSEEQAYAQGMVAEFRKFYDENGYLPHKAALRLIEIAEKLLGAYR